MPGLLHLAVTVVLDYSLPLTSRALGQEHWLPQQASHWGAGLPSLPQGPWGCHLLLLRGEPLSVPHIC